MLQEFVKGTVQENFEKKKKKKKTLLLHVLYVMHIIEPMTTQCVTMA